MSCLFKKNERKNIINGIKKKKKVSVTVASGCRLGLGLAPTSTCVPSRSSRCRSESRSSGPPRRASHFWPGPAPFLGGSAMSWDGPPKEAPPPPTRAMCRLLLPGPFPHSPNTAAPIWGGGGHQIKGSFPPKLYVLRILKCICFLLCRRVLRFPCHVAARSTVWSSKFSLAPSDDVRYDKWKPWSLY